MVLSRAFMALDSENPLAADNQQETPSMSVAMQEKTWLELANPGCEWTVSHLLNKDALTSDEKRQLDWMKSRANNMVQVLLFEEGSSETTCDATYKSEGR